MKAKRHATIVGPSLSSRSLVAATARVTLPTAAALAAMLALSPTAHAITSTTDAGAETEAATDADVEAGDADRDAGDAAYCPPNDQYPLGGVPAYPRVHGTGCGCGGGSSDDGPSTAFAAVALVAAFRLIRRS